MTSVADKFMAEFARMVALEVLRELDARSAEHADHARQDGPERLLTPDEAAGILRAKKNTLAVWRMTPGAGPDFIKRGRLIFYTPEAIHEYIDRRRDTRLAGPPSRSESAKRGERAIRVQSAPPGEPVGR